MSTKNISIKGKIILVISIAVFVIGSVFVSFFVWSEAKNIEESTIDKIHILAESEANKISSIFNLLMSKAESQKVYFENIIAVNQNNRSAASRMLYNMALSNSTICSSWVVFEANNFDNKDDEYVGAHNHDSTGRFVCWWIDVAGAGLRHEPLPVFDEEDWYIIMKKNMQPTLLEPYEYPLQDGSVPILISSGYPIINEGKYLGMTGNEINLSFIQEQISNVSVFEGNYACLISPSGIYAAHPNANKVGKNISEQGFFKNVEEAFRNKKEHFDSHYSEFLKTDVYDFYVPVSIMDIDESWYVSISVPQSLVKRQTVQIRNKLTLLLFGLLLSIIAIVYLIMHYAIAPVTRISNLITLLSKNEIDNANEIAVKSKDEIGDLSLSYNRLLHSLKEKRKVELELENHRNKLEFLVKERTEEYLAINEELSSVNEEYRNLNEKQRSKNEELRSTLEKLKEAQTQLFQSEKMASLGALIAGIAHEINNPLNYINGGIIGLEKIFDRDLKDQKPKAEKMLNAIQTGVKRTTEIISSLNNYNRHNKSRDELCDINSIIENCLLILNNQLKNRITVTKTVLENNPVVKGNVGELHQVFLNIIANAEQAIAEQGNIKINIESKANELHVFILDDGVGIDSNKLQRIIEPFYTTKPPGKGTGLGLSIASKIIQEHRGELKVLSKINEGTTMHIILPLNMNS